MLFPLECPFPIAAPGALLLSMQLKGLLLLEAFLALFPPTPSPTLSGTAVLGRNSVFTSSLRVGTSLVR